MCPRYQLRNILDVSRFVFVENYENIVILLSWKAVMKRRIIVCMCILDGLMLWVKVSLVQFDEFFGENH